MCQPLSFSIFFLSFSLTLPSFLPSFLKLGKGGRKRRRETSMWERNIGSVTSHMHPHWGPNLQPRHVPRLEWDQQWPFNLLLCCGCPTNWPLQVRALVNYFHLHCSFWTTWSLLFFDLVCSADSAIPFFNHFYNFLLMLEYSCLHFPPPLLPSPTHPHFPPSILPHFGFVHGSFIHVLWWPFPFFPPLFPSPLSSGYCQFILNSNQQNKHTITYFLYLLLS